MTKQIRVENACTSKFKVLVSIQDKVYDHNKNCITDEWVTIKQVNLDHPTFMLQDYITSTRRFIIEEVKEDN